MPAEGNVLRDMIDRRSHIIADTAPDIDQCHRNIPIWGMNSATDIRLLPLSLDFSVAKYQDN